MNNLTTLPPRNVIRPTKYTTTRTALAQNVRTFALQLPKEAGELRPAAPVPGLGNVVSTFVDIGPSDTQELTVIIGGFSLTTDVPAAVVCQPRQNTNNDFGFPDTFGVTVITTSAIQIVVRITRLDAGSGWGQDLRLDMIIFDSVNNP